MLSEALQRNAKHEARLSNISDLFPFGGNLRIVPEIESLASRTSSNALQLRSAQNDITGRVVVDSHPQH
jgi:hypothetical protein